MSSANRDNVAHLARLKREFDSIRGEIEACTQLWQRIALAKQRQGLLADIEECELQLESGRVAAAVSAFDEEHPPVTRDCLLCHKAIRLGAWKRPTLHSSGAPCNVLPCCAGVICKACFESTTTRTDGALCPVCQQDLPPVGSEEMRSLMIQNAEGGCAESQVYVGLCCLPNMGPCGGFDVDEERGFHWIRLAAEQQHPMALYMLGHAYQEGRGGIRSSPRDAFRLFSQAAELGSSRVHDQLGVMYLSGQGTVKDETRGVNHLTIAYGLGVCDVASYRLGMIFSVGMGPLERNLVLAKHYLEEASVKHVIECAYHPYADALLYLNMAQYDESIHIPGHSCIPKVIYWLRKAAEDNGDEDALNKSRRFLEGIQNYCSGCLKTAIGAPRAPGIDQCPGTLKRCNQCKAAWYCGKACQKSHWKLGHKVDCINPDDVSDKFHHVDKFNAAIRATVPPEEYEETRRKFARDLAAAIREVGPPPPPR